MTVDQPIKAAEPHRAWRMSAEEFAERSQIVSTLDDAKEKAKQIVAEAEKKSDAVLADVQDSLGDVVQMAETKVAEKLAEDVAKRREAETTKATLELLALSRTIQEDFESADAWLVELIMSALHRVFDDMDPESRAKGIILNALSETKSRWALRVKVHPSQLKVFQGLLEREAAALKGIETIVSDDTLNPDDVFFESAGGLTSIAHHDQLGRLQIALEQQFSETAASC